MSWMQIRQNKKYALFSGSDLKLMAIVFMTIDHVALHLLEHLPIGSTVLCTLWGHAITLTEMMRDIGRWAFPIFSFLLVEGYLHTKNRLIYARNLLLFAIISEIPWNLVFTNQLFYDKQNIFFTLFLGLVTISAWDRFQNRPIPQGLAIAGILLVSHFLQVDFGPVGVFFILLLYLLHHHPIVMALAGTTALPSTWIGGLAFFPILCYNGERGFVKGKLTKYAFYAYYPLHLLVIYALKYRL